MGRHRVIIGREPGVGGVISAAVDDGIVRHRKTCGGGEGAEGAQFLRCAERAVPGTGADAVSGLRRIVASLKRSCLCRQQFLQASSGLHLPHGLPPGAQHGAVREIGVVGPALPQVGITRRNVVQVAVVDPGPDLLHRRSRIGRTV